MLNRDEIKAEKSSLLYYGANSMVKRDNQLRELAVKNRIHHFDKYSTDKEEFQQTKLVNDNRISESTDAGYDELSITSDSTIETLEDNEPSSLRRYRLLSSDSFDIQVKKTPSSISTKRCNKYGSIDHKSTSPHVKIVTHHHPHLSSKSQQRLPNKPPASRSTYDDKHTQNETRRTRNRPSTQSIVQVEIIRLPILKITPEEYRKRSAELTRLDYIRSLTHDFNILQWRI